MAHFTTKLYGAEETTRTLNSTVSGTKNVQAPWPLREVT
jgi:hypothetical protein